MNNSNQAEQTVTPDDPFFESPVGDEVPCWRCSGTVTITGTEQYGTAVCNKCGARRTGSLWALRLVKPHGGTR